MLFKCFSAKISISQILKHTKEKLSWKKNIVIVYERPLLNHLMANPRLTFFILISLRKFMKLDFLEIKAEFVFVYCTYSFLVKSPLGIVG